jgi:hypothetical protein
MDSFGDHAFGDRVRPRLHVCNERTRERAFVYDLGDGKRSEMSDEILGGHKTAAGQVDVEQDHLLRLIFLVQARERAGAEEFAEGHKFRDAPVLLEAAQLLDDSLAVMPLEQLDGRPEHGGDGLEPAVACPGAMPAAFHLPEETQVRAIVLLERDAGRVEEGEGGAFDGWVGKLRHVYFP